MTAPAAAAPGPRFVAYYRVSTDRQGRSGLGLDAQRKAVRDFLDGGRWGLAAEFVEVESGKASERPELNRALAMCRVMRPRTVSRGLGLRPGGRGGGRTLTRSPSSE